MANAHCFCGAGWYRDALGYTIRSHAPDCLWLAWIVTLDADGVCAGCGESYRVTRGQHWKRQQCRMCGSDSFEAWMA